MLIQPRYQCKECKKTFVTEIAVRLHSHFDCKKETKSPQQIT